MSTVLGGAKVDRERRAWGLVAVMVGAIGIARAMPDGEEADRAIECALATATLLIS